MSDGAFPDRLTQLRNRWESDPTSRIFLQLAEEYRHQGRVKEALNVLEKGLKEHPGYLSALVAKGRCLIELGESEEARGVLERVVKQDATQMVANKLLVRAYLDTGEPERARERLDLYSLLNDSDSDIEELRRRIRSMEQAPQAERPDPTQRLAAPFPDLAPPPLAGGGDVFDLGGAPGPRPEVQDVFELEVAPPPPAAAAAPAGSGDVFDLPAPEAPPAFEAGEGDVFADLFAPESGARHLSALAAEGLFFFEAPAAPAPAPVPVEESAPEAAPAPPAPEPFAWDFERAASAPVEAPLPEEPVFLPEEEPAPAVAEHLAPELEDTTPWTAEPEPAPPLFEPEPGPQPAPEPAATVTLGELYLRQGHQEEAEGIFREVLRREPDNSAAHEALARLAPPPPPAPEPMAVPRALDAGEIVAELGEVPAGPAGANARKAFILRKYLERIRQGSERYVP